MNINKVSQSIAKQTPEFIGSEYPLFNKFIEYYYRSQEKTGLGQNILNNFLQYLDIDKLDIGILDGATKIVEPITANSENIVVESVDQFLDSNGSVLIGDEVVDIDLGTYVTGSPNHTVDIVLMNNSHPIDTAVYEVNADYCFTPLGDTSSLANYRADFSTLGDNATVLPERHRCY